MSRDYRAFAWFYRRISRSSTFRKEMDPWRQKLAQAATGTVLEIGAGGGQNFAFYDPAITSSVEAVEPNRHMLAQAKNALSSAKVPIHLQEAAVESLPFEDATFDAVLVTLVFCSVDAPDAGMREIHRVLKPSGKLLLFEHVRNPQPGWARWQDLFTPVQRRIAGNCHLNRDTGALVRSNGFMVTSEDWSGAGLHPQVAIIATR